MRQDEIVVMRAVGFSRASVTGLFVGEALMVVLVALAVGSIGGILWALTVANQLLPGAGISIPIINPSTPPAIKGVALARWDSKRTTSPSVVMLGCRP